MPDLQIFILSSIKGFDVKGALASKRFIFHVVCEKPIHLTCCIVLKVAILSSSGYHLYKFDTFIRNDGASDTTSKACYLLPYNKDAFLQIYKESVEIYIFASNRYEGSLRGS